MQVRELYDDHALFAAIAKGDEKAFNVFFDKYRLKIYSFILRSLRSEKLAEELTHDVLLGIWVQQERLLDIANPQGYLFAIVYNKIYSALSQLAKERQIDRSVFPEIADNSTMESLDARISAELMEKVIRTMPEQRQKVYRMSREAGMSHAEIAEALRISQNTVKNHIVDALYYLREQLKDAGIPLIIILFWPF